MKLIKYLLTITTLLIFNTSLVSAANLTITCDDSPQCSTSPSGGAALFSELEFPNYDVKPGDTIKRKIIVHNNNSENCNLYLKITNKVTSPLHGLDEVLNTAIADSAVNYYGSINPDGEATTDKTLENLYSDGVVNLGIVPTGASNIYDWIVSIDKLVGNEYQKAYTKFDFETTFECGNPFTPTPTPTTTNGGGGTGGPACNPDTQSKPVGPLSLTATVGVNSVDLSWNSVSPVTHYGVQYGLVPGNYIYGAANIGLATSLNVTGLSANTPYYFQVIAFNDCASLSSNEAIIIPTGTTVYPLGPAGGFTEGAIEGVKTELKVSPAPGEVGGVATCCPKICPEWWILLGLQTLILIRYFLKKLTEKKIGDWELVSVGSTIVVIILHWIFHPLFVNKWGYIKSQFCDWFWLMAIADGLILALVYRWAVRKSSK